MVYQGVSITARHFATPDMQLSCWQNHLSAPQGSTRMPGSHNMHLCWLCHLRDIASGQDHRFDSKFDPQSSSVNLHCIVLTGARQNCKTQTSMRELAFSRLPARAVVSSLAACRASLCTSSSARRRVASFPCSGEAGAASLSAALLAASWSLSCLQDESIDQGTM